MALIKCKECKNMISRDASICPHCGKPKPKKKSGCAIFLGIVAVIGIISAITSSQDGEKPAANSPSKSEKQIAEPPAQSKSPPTTQSAPIQSTPETTSEPNWNERINYWKDHFRGSFSKPSIGQEVDIVLTTGIAYRGSLRELTDQSITIQVDQGTLTFDKSNIRPESRLKLFYEDYLTYNAGSKVKAERDAHRARILERQRKEQQERAALEKAQQAEKTRKLFSAWDGSLFTLVNYTKKSMNDAKSFEHVETRYSDNGTDLTVWMKFRGKNMLGAMVLNTITAKVDYEGNVISILATDP